MNRTLENVVYILVAMYPLLLWKRRKQILSFWHKELISPVLLLVSIGLSLLPTAHILWGMFLPFLVLCSPPYPALSHVCSSSGVVGCKLQPTAQTALLLFLEHSHTPRCSVTLWWQSCIVGTETAWPAEFNIFPPGPFQSLSTLSLAGPHSPSDPSFTQIPWGRAFLPRVVSISRHWRKHRCPARDGRVNCDALEKLFGRLLCSSVRSPFVAYVRLWFWLPTLQKKKKEKSHFRRM
jgi:hypothetical protein